MSAGASVYTIPLGVPFVDALAAGLLARHGTAPLGLGAVTVLVPNRRAARALADAFLRATGGRPLLLPAIRAIQDVDEAALALEAPMTAGAASADLPEPIAPLTRQLILARLVAAWEERRDPAAPAARGDRAARLAAELARFIDQVHTARVDFADLDRLAPDDYAAHWQETLRFLAIARSEWPAILAEQARIDPADWRNRALAALAAQWRAAPPAGPVIAAGSTGSVPATADLLAVVAALPQGAVVLPGLDLDCDAESWDTLDETHAQFGLKRLLDRLGVERAMVKSWSADAPEQRAIARARLASE